MYDDQDLLQPLADLPPGTRLIERYLVEEPLGSGVQGQVLAALDLITQQPVAVKFYPPGAEPRARRRELNALRALDLPGVAQVLDEGRLGDRAWVVLERAYGQPFPAGATGWAELAPLATELLLVLGAAHERGVYHLDLKPEHVLVDGGRITLLDFGFARGPGVDGESAAPGGGNARYAAPEQLQGQRADARADLFAVAALLVEALTGHLPYRSLQDRLRGAPCCLPTEDQAPAHVRSALGRTLARQPSARPPDAWSLLEALGLDPTAACRAWFSDLPEVAALAARLGPPDPLLDQPTRQAAQLLRRFRSWPDLAHYLQRRTRSAAGRGPLLERLAPDSDWEDDPPPMTPEVGLQLTLQRAQLAEQRGDAGAALWLACRALGAARQDPSLPVDSTLRLLLRAALADGSPTAIRRAAYEVGRLPQLPEHHDAARILEAARLVLSGQPERALEDLPWPTQDPTLATPAAMVALLASGRVSPEQRARTLASLRSSWQGPEAEARLASWLGRQAYDEGRYREAVAFQEQAILRPVPPSVSPLFRVSACIHLAVAALELDPPLAERYAHQALDQARLLRAPNFAGRALWVLRQSAYRQARDEAPSPDLVETAEQYDLGATVGHLALTEAAFAWRQGQLRLARTLANTSRLAFLRARVRPGAALAGALAHACGDPATLDEDLLLRAHPEVLWQVVALVWPTHPTWAPTAAGYALQAAHPHQRREVLSPQEALSRITNAPAAALSS